MCCSGGGGENPSPTDPKQPASTGKYECPFSVWSKGPLYEDPHDGLPVYSMTEVPRRIFPYALDDYLGTTGWRDWDGRLKWAGDLRGCRGNGYVDLNVSILDSDEMILSGKYPIIKGKRPGAFGNIERFIHFDYIDAYVSLSDIGAYHSLGVVVGFWKSSDPMIPYDFSKFSQDVCPAEVCLVVPRT